MEWMSKFSRLRTVKNASLFGACVGAAYTMYHTRNKSSVSAPSEQLLNHFLISPATKEAPPANQNLPVVVAPNANLPVPANNLPAIQPPNQNLPVPVAPSLPVPVAPALPVPVVPALPVPSPPISNIPQADNPIMKYGYPGTSNLIHFDGHVVSFDFRTRNAFWSCEHLNKDAVAHGKDNVASRSNIFKEDASIPDLFRPKNSDYQGSGFDRGHLVPAADLKNKGQKAMDDTFFISNISPQVGSGFNRDYWARLESFVRKVARENDDVYVCTGPLFMPRKENDGKTYVKYQLIGDPPSVAVPTHFYKVILAVKNPQTPSNPTPFPRYSMGGFIIPNAYIPEETPVEMFAVPLENVEKAAGLQFFNQVQRRNGTTIPLCEAQKCILPAPRFWEKGKPQQQQQQAPNNQKK